MAAEPLSQKPAQGLGTSGMPWSRGKVLRSMGIQCEKHLQTWSQVRAWSTATAFSPLVSGLSWLVPKKLFLSGHSCIAVGMLLWRACSRRLVIPLWARANLTPSGVRIEISASPGAGEKGQTINVLECTWENTRVEITYYACWLSVALTLISAKWMLTYLLSYIEILRLLVSHGFYPH